MLTITKYNEMLFDEWEKFISHSNNGTIFQKKLFFNTILIESLLMVH